MLEISIASLSVVRLSDSKVEKLLIVALCIQLSVV